MLTKQVYICENCGHQSFDKEEIRRCEAYHLGLTAKEMQEWEGLKDDVELWKRLSRTNRDAKITLTLVSQNLFVFEVQHGLAAHTA